MEIRVDRMRSIPELHYMYVDGYMIGCMKVVGNTFVAEFDGFTVYDAPTQNAGFLSGFEVEKYITEGIAAVRVALEAELFAQSEQQDQIAQEVMDQHIDTMIILDTFDWD